MAALYLNRELSWVAFNMRVQELARDDQVPLLERVRFLSIAASNLDEFLMVRVAGLRAMQRHNPDRVALDGRNAGEQLGLISTATHQMMDKMQEDWRSLRAGLAAESVQVLKKEDLSADEVEWVKAYFETDIFPVLTPLAVDDQHPFPHLPNKELAIMLHLSHAETGESVDAVVPIPSILPRFVTLPGREGEKAMRVIPMERVIMANLQSLFPPLDCIEFSTFRVIRDGYLAIDDEAQDLLHNIRSALKKRRRGQVIQLMVYHSISDHGLDYLRRALDCDKDAVFRVDGLVGLSDLAQLTKLARPELLYPSYTPREPERVREAEHDIFKAVAAKDMVIHHPYESFDVVVKFLEQAASDPDVTAIKQTLYRTSKDSPIVKALIRAAEAGKAVTAVVELKARFDEEANLRWAKDLEQAGAKVIFGSVHMKTHAKLSLVVRKGAEGQQLFAHFGTGNYHPETARVYTDLSFFTCDPVLCGDMVRIFNAITSQTAPDRLMEAFMAPFFLRDQLIHLIDREILNAKAGKPAAIWAKMNALIDQQMIDKFYEASQAGVKIELIIRGLCCLRPGVEGLSDHIRVRSLVGRFLEHARIYAFANGQDMPSDTASLWIASADLMGRNLDDRFESFVPIRNKTVHQQILNQILVANLKDRTHSWVMKSDGSYTRLAHKQDDFSAHAYFMENPSLSGRGSAIVDGAPMPPALWLDEQE